MLEAAPKGAIWAWLIEMTFSRRRQKGRAAHQPSDATVSLFVRCGVWQMRYICLHVGPGSSIVRVMWGARRWRRRRGALSRMTTAGYEDIGGSDGRQWLDATLHVKKWWRRTA